MANETQVWTVITLLQRTISHLQDKDFDNARLEAELLLAHILGYRRLDLYLQFDRPLSTEEVNQFRDLVQRRLRREPLQYILGETEFMSLPFHVGTGVLIPRPETEVLVEHALSICERLSGKTNLSILDVGTGCGNIAVALAGTISNCKVLAIDGSAAALAYAEKNAARHAVSDRVFCRQFDIRTPVPGEWYNRFDLIVSNPPYIRECEYRHLPDEILRHEPKEALLAGTDGLDFYQILRQNIPILLQPEGYAILEIGADMGSKMRDLFDQSKFSDIQIIPDLSGRDRVVSLRLKKENVR